VTKSGRRRLGHSSLQTGLRVIEVGGGPPLWAVHASRSCRQLYAEGRLVLGAVGFLRSVEVAKVAIVTPRLDLCLLVFLSQAA
jgi:hypothetical protein